MPLRLVPPRKGKSPNYTIRGTYLHVSVDKSSGTNRRRLAGKILKNLERAIERGEYPPKEAAPDREQPTFLNAAVAYMESGDERVTSPSSSSTSARRRCGRSTRRRSTPQPSPFTRTSSRL